MFECSDTKGLGTKTKRQPLSRASDSPEEACRILQATWMQRKGFGIFSAKQVGEAASKMIEVSADIFADNCGCLCEEAIARFWRQMPQLSRKPTSFGAIYIGRLQTRHWKDLSGALCFIAVFRNVTSDIIFWRGHGKWLSDVQTFTQCSYYSGREERDNRIRGK